MMRPESADADRPQYSAHSFTVRARVMIIARACERTVRYLIVGIVIAMLIGAADLSSRADTVRTPAIALPFGDIVIPIPVRPTNADPANPASPGDVVTQRYNNLRTGTTLHGELDQSAVSDDGHFGFIGALNVDGTVLAQPLFMQNVDFPNGRHPGVFVATSKNWIYAFDADGLGQQWKHQLRQPYTMDHVDKGEHCLGQMENNGGLHLEGIQSTPVIDFARQRIIVSYRAADPEPGGKLHIAALDLRSGNPAKGADGLDLDHPIDGDGDPFWNQIHRNRASLLLDGDHVYVAFAGRCEASGFSSWPSPSSHENDQALQGKNFQGWIYAFDAATLTLAGKYRATQSPNGTASSKASDDPVAGGGIWQASSGLAADGRGSLYFATGNQSKGVAASDNPADAIGKNLPNSIVRLGIARRPGSARPGATISMTPTDWFTPYRKSWLNRNDLDLGSAGVLLIPNTWYLVAGGKEGILYLLDRDNLGKFDDAPFPDPYAVKFATSQDMPDDLERDHVVQKFRAAENQYCAGGPPLRSVCLSTDYPAGSPPHNGVEMLAWGPWPHIHGTPVFGAFPDGEAFLYVWAEKDFLKSFRWLGNSFQTAPAAIGTKLGTGERLLAPPFLAHVPDKLDDKGNPASIFGMPGGFLTLTINLSKPDAGVLFASVQRCRTDPDDGDFTLQECSVPRCRARPSSCWNQAYGMLRAFDPISLRELWNNQIDKSTNDAAKKKYIFAKFTPPMIAHGRVFLPTADKGVLVYGRH
jgi:hypothetical protein